MTSSVTDVYELNLATSGKLALRAKGRLAEGSAEDVFDACVLLHEAARHQRRATEALLTCPPATLVPMQDPESTEGLSKVTWEDDVLSLAGSSFDKEIVRATREREWVITAWAPPHLGALLGKWFWKDDRPTAPMMKVWLDTCRYLYMPRLQTEDVFLQTVRDGVGHTDWFAYAAGAKEGGAFEGLVFGASGGVYLSEGSLLVRPDAAASAQAAAGTSTTGSERPRDAPPASVAGKAKKQSGAPVETAPRRFHGTAIIDPKDPIRHFAEVVQDVIEHFTAQYGTEVVLTLDVEARRGEGFDPKTVRVVRENSGVLKLKTADFEED